MGSSSAPGGSSRGAVSAAQIPLLVKTQPAPAARSEEGGNAFLYLRGTCALENEPTHFCNTNVAEVFIPYRYHVVYGRMVMKMTLNHPTLWAKIEAFAFDDPDVDRPFSQRLAEENGWTREYAREVIEEYRRFLYLGVTIGHPVTPSDPVDQAWHLHLLYTQSYWENLCRDTLQTPFHHGPSRGGRSENEKYTDFYRRTLDSYQTHFGPAPASVWPVGPQTKQHHQRIDMIAFEKQVKRKYLQVLSLGFASGALLSATIALCYHSL